MSARKNYGFERERAGMLIGESLEREIAKFGSRMALQDELAYAIRYHRTTDRRPLDFKRFPFLPAIYQDPARYVVIKKCVQCCISERAVVRALSRAESGWAVLYVLQSQAIRNKFVPYRIDRLFDVAPHYREKQRASLGDVDARMMKNFGLGLIVFAGSNSADEFTSLPIDSLIIDELDECHPVNLLLAPDRLERSSLAEEMRISRPSLERFGIDAEFLRTDRKRWHVRCGGCGERQDLEWFRNVVREVSENVFEVRDKRWAGDARNGADLRPVCRRCEKALDRLGPGEWVAEAPDADRSGYEISQLFTPIAVEGGRLISSLWTEFEEALTNASKMARFMSSKLGKAYTAPGAKLTDEALRRCADPEWALPTPKKAARATAGVDVGKVFHVRISDEPRPGLRRAVFIGTVPTIEDLDALIRRFEVSLAVVDMLPETHLVKKLRDAHRGRVYLAEFVDRAGREVTIKRDEFIVQVNRTEWFDRSHEDIARGVNVLPRDFETLDGGEFVRQMKAPTRKLTENARGEPRIVWDEGSEPDHHRLADVYDVIARELVRLGLGGGRGFAM